MECFFLDGSSKSFADVILDNLVCGGECLVASYGFGVLQVRKLVNSFDSVVLVADISHAKLNAEAYDMVVDMSSILPNFSFIATKTHAKLALIDDEIIIFTSANLSANRRFESYMIGKFKEFNGIEKLKEIFKKEPILTKKEEVKFNIIKTKYFNLGGVNEPSYTHVVDDKGCYRP